MAIDQRKLTKESVFSGQGTAAELAADFDEVAALEASFKARVALIRWSALAAFLLFVVLAIKVGSGFVVLAMLVPIGILVYSGIVSQNGVLTERATFLGLILKTLSQDAGQRGRFKVQLRLRKKREKTHEGPHPYRKGEKLRLYRDPWLTLDGRLKDGTAIHESCVDLIRQRVYSSSSGKIRMKDKRLCLLRIQLDYDPKHYGDATLAAKKVAAPFRLPAGAAMKATSLTPQAFAMKAIVKGDVSPAALLRVSEALMLGAYRVLNLSRRATPAGGAR